MQSYEKKTSLNTFAVCANILAITNEHANEQNFKIVFLKLCHMKFSNVLREFLTNNEKCIELYHCYDKPIRHFLLQIFDVFF